MNSLIEFPVLVGLAIVNFLAVALWLASRSRVVLRQRRRAAVSTATAIDDAVESNSAAARPAADSPATGLEGFGSRGEAELAVRIARWRKRGPSLPTARGLDEWIVETEQAEQAVRARSVRR